MGRSMGVVPEKNLACKGGKHIELVNTTSCRVLGATWSEEEHLVVMFNGEKAQRCLSCDSNLGQIPLNVA